MPELEDINLGAVSKDDPQKQIESVVKQLNEQARAISNENKTKVIKSDSGIETLTFGQLPPGGNGLLIRDSTDTPRAIFGELPDGSIALKLSQTGADVTSATDDQLIWSSDFNLFKIVQTASQAVTLTHIANTVAAGTQTTTIAHNLGYTPSSFVYVTTPSTYIDGATLVMLPEIHILPAGHALGGGTAFNKFYATVDSTNLYVKFFHRVGTDYSPDTPTFTIRYYLIRETAS